MYNNKSFNTDLVTLGLRLKPTIDKLHDLSQHYGLQDKEGEAHVINECIDIMKEGIRQIERNAKDDVYDAFEEIASNEGTSNIGEASQASVYAATGNALTSTAGTMPNPTIVDNQLLTGWNRGVGTTIPLGWSTS